MTYSEKQARNAQKRALLLGFLASGEVWTTLAVAAELLQATERTALRLLQSLIQEKLLKVDEGVVPHSNLKLYGITSHGVAMTGNAHPQAREFQLGRTNPSWVEHHTQGQLIRIRAEQAGWTNWVPGKLLMVENTARLKKLPDALSTRPDGRQVAIEIERYIKSHKRMADVIGAHLQQIVGKKYDFVYYFCPNKAALDRAFAKVEFVVIDSNKIKLQDSHRARFKTFEIKTYRGEM
jgi:hypothetical protein